MTTTNMGLTKPTVGVTADPDWANELNDNTDLLDAHDHTSGKGARITPAALDIDSPLSMQDQPVIAARAVAFTNQILPPSNNYSLFWQGGELWLANGAGVALQLTTGSGTSLKISTAVGYSYGVLEVSINTVIPTNSAYSMYVNKKTTDSITFTLPPAAGVAKGRAFTLKQGAAEAAFANIIVQRSGADTIDLIPSTWLLNQPHQCNTFVSDGVSNWYVVPGALDESSHLHADTVIAHTIGSEDDADVALQRDTETKLTLKEDSVDLSVHSLNFDNSVHITEGGGDMSVFAKADHTLYIGVGTANVVEVGNNAIGFYGTGPQSKKTVTGSRGSNAALASLLTALADLGLITNSST